MDLHGTVPAAHSPAVGLTTQNVETAPAARTLRDMAASAEPARTMLPVHQAGQCSVAATGEIVGSKWTVLIVHDLSEGPRRFTELEHACAGISPRTLAERLRWLEAEGIVVDRKSVV